MSYSVHVHTPDPQSSDPATAGTARTGNRAAYGRILALALPTFGQLIAEPTFVLIDTAIVGHIGVSALAGLSIGSTIILTAVGLCIFLAYSTTAQVAHLLGAGRRREGLQAGIDGLWLALGIGIVLAAALFAGARPLCVGLRGTGETLDQAVAYTQTVVLGAPGMLLVYAANGIFRGLQKVRITLVAAVCGAVLNTMLDVLFVFGFGWGIAGSGAATMIAQWFMGLFLTVPAVLWAKADGAALRPRLSGIAAAGGDGLPLFIRTLAIRAAMVMTVASAARLGTTVLAGFQAVNSSWNFAMNMLDSVGIAGQTLVGAAMGAGDRARTLRLTRATGRAGLAAGAAIGCGFAVAGLFVGRLFSPNPHVQLLVRHGDDGCVPATTGVDDGAGRHTDRRPRFPLSGDYLHTDRDGVYRIDRDLRGCGRAHAARRPGLDRAAMGDVQYRAHGRPRPVQWPAHTQRIMARSDRPLTTGPRQPSLRCGTPTLTSPLPQLSII